MNVTGYATLTIWMHTRSGTGHGALLLWFLLMLLILPGCWPPDVKWIHYKTTGWLHQKLSRVQGNFLWEFHEAPKLHSLFFFYCKNTPFLVGPTINMHQLTKMLTFFVRICSVWVCFLPLAQLMRQKIHHENHCWQFLQHSDQQFFGWLHDHILFLWVKKKWILRIAHVFSEGLGPPFANHYLTSHIEMTEQPLPA